MRRSGYWGARICRRHGGGHCQGSEVVGGVFYDRFKDKETLLNCLHERFCQESYATADEALSVDRWREASLEQILHKLVRFLVQIYREHLGLMRAFMVRCGTDRTFAERGMQLHGYIARKLAALLLAHRGQIAHPRPEFAVEFGMRMVGSTLDSFVLFDDVDTSGIGLHDEETSRELTQVFLSYLRSGRGSRKRGFGRSKGFRSEDTRGRIHF